MLQPSQVPTYILFMTFIVFLNVLFIAVYRWALRKRIRDMRQSPDFTEQDVIAVRHQMLALMIGVPLFLLFLFLSPLGWNLRQPFVFFLAFLIGFAPLAFISVSSIQNRVSIFNHVSIFRQRSLLPVKGTKAVRNGVTYLVFIVLLFTGFAIYFASIK